MERDQRGSLWIVDKDAIQLFTSGQLKLVQNLRLRVQRL
jgi:hypothetical protein